MRKILFLLVILFFGGDVRAEENDNNLLAVRTTSIFGADVAKKLLGKAITTVTGYCPVCGKKVKMDVVTLYYTRKAVLMIPAESVYGGSVTTETYCIWKCSYCKKKGGDEVGKIK